MKTGENFNRKFSTYIKGGADSQRIFNNTPLLFLNPQQDFLYNKKSAISILNLKVVSRSFSTFPYYNKELSKFIENKNNNSNILFVSSVIYNNIESQKLNILTENKNKAGVYLLTHLESQNKYIGSSVNLSRRLKYYFSKVNIARHTNSRIHNALLLYGHSSFSLTILEYIEIENFSIEEAKNIILEREQYFIDKISPEYNILKTAGSLLGFKHSRRRKETILKFKNSKSKSKNPMYGKLHSIETREILSNLKKGISRSEEVKLKLSKKVFVYLNDPILNKKILFKSFDSYLETSKYLNCSLRTIQNYVNKNKLYKKKWFLYTSLIED